MSYRSVLKDLEQLHKDIVSDIRESGPWTQPQYLEVISATIYPYLKKYWELAKIEESEHQSEW